MPVQRVALVGHCGFDSSSLTRFAQDVAPQAKVVRINDQTSLEKLADAGTLLMINRVLDGRFDAGDSGLALIQSLAQQDNPPPTMLVSNYDDAQQDAQAAGALPGFGKSQVGDAATRQRVADAITKL